MYLIFILSSFFISFTSFAGSCCGGGSFSAQIMIGDTDSVWRTSYSNQTILADTTRSGKIEYRPESELESIKILNLSYSKKISDLSQWGVSTPIIEKTRMISNEWESLSGLGDLKFNMAYEFLPEYSRSAFISQGFIFFEIAIPTAPSIYTTKRTDALDTRGTGHYLYSMGSVLKKRQRYGQSLLTIALTYRPSQTFKDSFFSEDDITTQSSLDNQVSFNQDIDLTKNTSTSLAVSRVYTRNKITSLFANTNQDSLTHPVSIGINYMQNDYSFSLTYTDEMIIPSGYGHTLGRTIALGLIKRVRL